jgi:hypothetical protein
MIIPYSWPLTVYVGTDFEDEIIFTQGGVPLDLTDYTAYDQIRPSQSLTDGLIAEFACAITPAEGKVRLSLTDMDTRVISAASGYHTLVLRDPSGLDLPFAMGEVTFIQTTTVLPEA